MTTLTRTLIHTALVLLSSVLMLAQTPDSLPVDFVSLGVGVHQENAIQANGYMAWGHHLSGTLYSFTRADIVGVSHRPFGIQTVMTTGVCDVPHILWGHLLLGACLDGGAAVSGVNVGGAIGADMLAAYRFGTKKNLAVVVMGGFVKSALSGSVNPVRLGFIYGF